MGNNPNVADFNLGKWTLGYIMLNYKIRHMDTYCYWWENDVQHVVPNPFASDIHIVTPGRAAQARPLFATDYCYSQSTTQCQFESMPVNLDTFDK